jgi:aminopeptidase N
MRQLQVAGLAGVLSLTLALPVLGGAPFSFDKAPGRLPKNVVPIDYTLDVDPDVSSMRLVGHEQISLRVRSATRTIQFNSLNETLSDVRFDGQPVQSVTSDDGKQLTTVTLSVPATVGQHTLSFSYVGKIETSAMGLFAQRYSYPQAGLMLSTQMEATDARRMFPCWDEPAFRATFELTMHLPAVWAAVSNMPIATRTVEGDRATVTFQRSPKMPSYLVEFSGGDLTHIEGSSNDIPLGVWTVRGREQDAPTALANAQTILADYNDYFGYRYPLPKLDSIAVPGGFSGAMENWGAITYNDQTLLVSAVSALADKQTVFSVQAHEMAHQWNGDLVTMGWWDDIWLNESFASWMAAKETDRRHPEWKWWEEQDGEKEAAMQADARASSHPIQVHVTDELQVTNAFDHVITYAKGQAILRMLESYLRPDTFRSGIRRYMKAHAFSNATSVDLWNALSAASGKPMAQIASSWTEQAGFPLVSVQAQCSASGDRRVLLAQSRFLLSGAPDAGPTRWNVPLQVRVGFGADTRSVLLTRNGQALNAGRCDEPLSINADAIGYYRTRYDAATLATDTRYFGRLPDADRIAMLDDQWALARSGQAPLSSYMALVSAMGSDLDARAWTQIIGTLESLEYDERDTSGHEAFLAYARSALQPTLGALGWDAKPGESPSVQKVRERLITDLGQWGDEAVVAEARRRFEAFLKDRQAIPPDDQRAILEVVAHNADATTFDQIYGLGKAAGDETEGRRYFEALARVGDAGLAERVAQLALSDDVPPQAETLRLQLIVALAHEHPQLAWQTFTANSERLLKGLSTFAPIFVAQSVPQIFWHTPPLTEVENWVRAHVPAEMSSFVDRGVESARIRLAEKTAMAKAVDDYLTQRGS